MTRFIAIAAILAYAAADARAATGNEAFEGCVNLLISNKDVSPFYQGMCVGVVSAIMDTSSQVCPPDHTTDQQGVRMLVQYMQRHQEMLHLDLIELATSALSEVWPCPKR